MTYNRSEISDSIGFSEIIDCKFKTNLLKINFITELTADTAAENAVAAGILATSNSNFKTFTELNAKLAALYGSAIYAEAKKRGDVQILSLCASWLDNRYALENEDITAEMLELFSDCIFSPNAKNDAFDTDSFNIRKKDVLDKIDSEINNKRSYAISQASKIAYSGEPAEFSCYGEKETAMRVTEKSSFEAYKKLLANARIEILFVTAQHNADVAEKLSGSFSSLVRNEINKCALTSQSTIKDEIAEVTQQLDVNQSKMVMVFKSLSDDYTALKLLSTVYGETPFSKLFANVREKLSLCYYCASNYVKSKNTMFVDCGVEKDNIDKARTEIINQLDEIKNGNFSDEDIENTLMSIQNSLSAIGDVPSSYTGWYFGRFCEGDCRTPDEVFSDYKAVTRERIMNAAASMKLDTVYVMAQKEVQD